MHMPDFIPVSSALHKTSVTHDFTTLGVIISFHHHLLLWYTCYLITGTSCSAHFFQLNISRFYRGVHGHQAIVFSCRK